MKYITVLDNKVISTRTDSLNRILAGEVVDNGTYGNIGDVLINEVWQKDPSEIAEQEKQQRILQLKENITNKNYLSEVVTNEQAELKTLLEINEYVSVANQIQLAIDAYTLELIEGGVI